jgi:hypothetical protein
MAALPYVTPLNGLWAAVALHLTSGNTATSVVVEMLRVVRQFVSAGARRREPSANRAHPANEFVAEPAELYRRRGITPVPRQVTPDDARQLQAPPYVGSAALDLEIVLKQSW